MKVNTELLKDWLKTQKKNNPSIRADLMKKARISPSTLAKVITGKLPGPQTRFMLAHVTGLDEEKLFPRVTTKEAA